VFTLTAVVAAIAGALYYPQAGIINPAEIAPIASFYLAVWVAIGGRGRLYGAVIGAASRVAVVISWLTGGSAPQYRPWVLPHCLDRLVAGAAGLGFVAVTLFFPKGIGGLFDLICSSPWQTGRAITAPIKAHGGARTS
jgi:urea transport system permease protein